MVKYFKNFKLYIYNKILYSPMENYKSNYDVITNSNEKTRR